MSCIRKLAVKEPLVDTVEGDAVVTNAWKFSVSSPLESKSARINCVASYRQLISTL